MANSILLTLVLLTQAANGLQSNAGAISGVLKTAAGRPAVGIRVTAMAIPQSPMDAISSFSMVSLSETDINGRYRLENIPPGRYYIAAGSVDNPTYFPGTMDLAKGSIVAVAAQASISGIDFVQQDCSVRAANTLSPRAALSVPKRKPGEFRTIAQPAKEVKALQYWLIKYFLGQFEVHQSAVGYREGLGISDNARPHVNSKFLLKLDFKDFFPSLVAADFRAFLRKKKVKLEPGDEDALQRILFWKPKGTDFLCLSIGAPSSPLLSNLLLGDFDRHVANLCQKNDVVYTRYADDMSFSADVSEKLKIVEMGVVQICSEMNRPRLIINPEKIARVSKKRARRITGLVLTNDAKVSLGREQKRRIRATVHHFLTGKLSEGEIQKLRGMLAFVKSVEPNFLKRLRKKYGSDIVRRIQTA